MISNTWEHRYQQGDTGWDRGTPSPALTYWLHHGLKATQRILVPGCGRGHEVVALAKLGFEVTALDFAPSAIQDLKQSLEQQGLHVDLVCQDLYQYEPENAAFDAVYEQTCLCALEPQQRQAYADRLYAWLKPKGRLYFSMMQTGKTGGPPYHCDWLDMKALFPDTHWQWQTTPPMLISRPQGVHYELAFLLQKRTIDSNP